MSMFLPKLKHALLVKLMNFMGKRMAGSSYMAFAGPGSSLQLCRHISRSGVTKVLIVTDTVLRELGVVDKVVEGLLAADIDLAYYDGVQPDPTYDQVAEGVKVLQAHGSQAVLAVGGGSSIDAAKIIAASSNSSEPPQSWVGMGKIKHEFMKIYAVPTTAGTVSDATLGAVISDSKTHEKGVIGMKDLLPAAVALDPELALGLPPHITAATGMDALTHGIEAYIGVWERGTRLEHGSAAVKLVFEHLKTAYHVGSNLIAREGLAMGAYYGGIAINQVNVGNVHAIAHQLGAKYSIPHGLANAMVLPEVLEFCREEAQARLAELAVLVGAGAEGEDPSQLAHKFIQAVRDLRTEVGISSHSEKIQVEDFDELCTAAIAEGSMYPVPKLLEAEHTKEILHKLLP
jgi:alcohol dehydrogenase